jgi:hypothetical protein
MKTLISLLSAAMLLLVVGCSQDLVGPVAVSPSNAVAKISFNMERIASLGKVTANATPTKILLWVNLSPRPAGNPDPVADTILVSGLGTVTKYLSGFQKASEYVFEARVFNSDNVQLNGSAPVKVSVGSADTFAVDFSLLAQKQKAKIKVPISGTPVASSACSVSVKMIGYMPSSSPQTISRMFYFAPGSLDTALVDELIPVVGNTSYTVEITIYLKDGLGFYKGSSSVEITPSVNASLVIPLTKYGSSGSLAKMVIYVNALGQLDVSVNFL